MPFVIPSANPDDLPEIAAQARRLADALDRLAKDGRPAPLDLIDAPVIDAWRPARRMAPALIGQVTGHPLLRSDKPKVTSELFALDRDGHWARTWSRWYRLAALLPIHGRRQ